MGALPYHNKLTRDRIAAADGRFNRIRQVTPICVPMWSHWRHLANAIEIVHNDATWRIWLNLCFIRPTRIYNPNGISIVSAVFAQMTAECPYSLQCDAPFPLKIASSHVGSGPSSGSLGPPESSTQTASRSVQPFLQGSLVWMTDRQRDRQTTLLGR